MKDKNKNKSKNKKKHFFLVKGGLHQQPTPIFERLPYPGEVPPVSFFAMMRGKNGKQCSGQGWIK